MKKKKINAFDFKVKYHKFKEHLTGSNNLQPKF